MDLYPTDDQIAIIDSAADYLSRELPADRMPKQEGPPKGQWRGIAAMGWFGLGLAEEVGGLGLSVVEEALVAREFGRHLAPPQATATMLAVHLAAGAGDGALAEALMAGDRRAGFAVPQGEAGPFHLVDAEGADLFVVWRPTAGLLATREAFANVAPAACIDDSLQLCEASGLDLSALAARDESAGFQHRARILTAAVMTGGAEAARDLAVEYAKVRQQFGKAIGAYQAISHRCANMAVDCEAALALLQYAAVCVRDGLPQADLYAPAAKLVAGDAARDTAASAMQIHGGYGQTYEYLPHFYLKRAHIYRALGGGKSADGAPVIAARSTL
jgi:alkylation response protein AidB-like acyl-CoA dehydrogenase